MRSYKWGILLGIVPLLWFACIPPLDLSGARCDKSEDCVGGDPNAANGGELACVQGRCRPDGWVAEKSKEETPKEKQPDEKPVERREPPPIDKREVVPEDGGNEQIPDKPIPSCPANGLRITSINGTGSAREPSEVPSSLTDVRKATNRLQDKLVVTGSGLSKVSRVEIKELKTTLMMTVTKDTKMTLELTTALKLTKNTLYTLLFFLSTSSVCSAKVYLLQGEKGDSAGISQQESLQLKALLKNISASNDQVTIKADTFKVMNKLGNKNAVSVDMTGDGSIDFKAKTIVADVGSLKVAFGGKDYFKVDTDAKKANFDGLNVQITNGTNQTDSTNGVGNLIIGYNETRSSTVASKDRNGSHYLILGSGAHYTGYAGIVAGKDNTVKGNYSSILGGQENTIAAASGTSHPSFAAITGGEKNNVTANYASVTGGQSNTADGLHSSVTGGLSNTAEGLHSSVTGGKLNKSEGQYSSILGGSGKSLGKNDTSKTLPAIN